MKEIAALIALVVGTLGCSGTIERPGEQSIPVQTGGSAGGLPSTGGVAGVAGTAGVSAFVAGAGGASTGGAAGSDGFGAGGSGAGSAGSSGGFSGAAAGSGGAAGDAGSGAGDGSGGVPPMPAPVLPCFVDEGTPAGDAIDLQMKAKRLSGVAPLAVMFETVGTTTEATSRPFHDLSYCWDFGDPDSGAYTTTGASKNQARGPSSGHVFETPGTYTVTVSARDATGRVKSAALEITVDDPDVVFAGTATTCLSPGGDFNGCPDGATQTTGSSLNGLQSSVAPGRRLLLQRGATFTGGLRINVQGPGIVGAYGPLSDPRPIIDMSQEVFHISDQDPDFSDWRLMDMEIIGQPSEESIVYVGGLATDLLVLRLKGSDMGEAVEAPDSVIDYWLANGKPGHDVIDGLTIADCEFRDITGGGGFNISYIAAHHLMFLGSVYNNSTGGEHVVRTPWVDRGVFSNNDFGDAPSGRHVLKMHGPKFSTSGIGQGKYTEQVVISDNVFRSSGGHDWTVAIGPQNDQSDERVRDILMERNLFLPGTALVGVIVWAQDVTLRNNLMNRGAEGTCISGGTRGLEPAPTRIAVINNTCYSEASKVTMVAFDASATNVSAFNNLVTGPTAGTSAINAAYMQASNLFTASPGLTKSPPTSAADFALLPDSPAVDAADPSVNATWDFHGMSRPVDGDGSGSSEPDVGAVEYVP
jgi:hypothetical protein